MRRRFGRAGVGPAAGVALAPGRWISLRWPRRCGPAPHTPDKARWEWRPRAGPALGLEPALRPAPGPSGAAGPAFEWQPGPGIHPGWRRLWSGPPSPLD